jgi:hypothetical protein
LGSSVERSKGLGARVRKSRQKEAAGAAVDSVSGQGRFLVQSAMAVQLRVVEGKAAVRRRAAGWRGSQSGECGQSLWEGHAGGSGAEAHRGIEAAVFLHYYERGRASER